MTQVYQVLFVCLALLQLSTRSQAEIAWKDSLLKKGEACFGISRKAFVDIHAHAGCHGNNSSGEKSGCIVGEALKGNFLKYYGIPVAFGMADKILFQNDEDFFPRVSEKIRQSSCLQSAVLLALDGPYRAMEGASIGTDGEPKATEIDRSKVEYYVPNEWVASKVKAHDNLLWGASINPLRADWKKQIDFALANGAVLIKLIPSIMGFTLDDPRHLPRLNAYYDYVARMGLPLLIHVDDEGTFGKEHAGIGTFRLRHLLNRGVTVIVAHMSTRGVSFAPESGAMVLRDNYDQLMDLMKEKKFERLLFADFSALPIVKSREQDLCRVLADLEILKGRLLWGSDYPLNHWATTSYYSRSKFKCKNGIGWDKGVFNKWSALGSNVNQWDRGILLQFESGVPEELFHSTRHFLVQRKLVKLGSHGELLKR